MSVAARAIIWAQTGVLQPANNSIGHVNPHGENVTVNKKKVCNLVHFAPLKVTSLPWRYLDFDIWKKFNFVTSR